MDEQITRALVEALTSWCNGPTAFVAARSGGAESVLRNVVLGRLESELGLLAFTEANGLHIDAVLTAPDSPSVSFEFKHGMLHPALLPSIQHDVSNAVAKLRQLENATARYYVHFVHGLECDDPNGGFAALHNGLVATPYKQFQTSDALNVTRQSVNAIFQQALGLAGVELAPLGGGFIIQPLPFADVRARLYCWLYRVEPVTVITLS